MRELQRRLLHTGGPARTQLAVTAGLGIAATALVIAQATLLARLVVAVFLSGDQASAVSGTFVALALVVLGRGLVAFGFEAAGRAGAARVMAFLRLRLARAVLCDRPGELDDGTSGELAAAAVQGVDALEAYYARYLPQVVLAAFAPLAIIAWALPRDWQAAAILAVTFPLIPVFMVLIGRLAESRVRTRWRALSRLSGHFLDVVRGLETLRAYNRADAQAESIAAASERYRRETMATLRVAFLSALVLELLAMVGTALVAVTVGLQLAAGTLGLTAGLTVLLLAPELYGPLRQLGAQFHASADGLAAAERLFTVLDSQPTRNRAGRVAAPDPAASALAFDAVSFAYQSRQRPVLEALDLELPPGTVTAVVGPSGAGKSTLAALALGLLSPTSGTVTCAGVDLAGVDPAAWRSRVAWLPQRPTLFTGSAAENIALAEPDAPIGRIRAAAAAAGCLELLERLPEGLDTRIGEGGHRLSAGESQRLALARAYLADPRLVVLDEPTANLDRFTADRVWGSIRGLVAGRTALLVTHRTAFASEADRIFDLRTGRLTVRDTERAAGVGA